MARKIGWTAEQAAAFDEQVRQARALGLDWTQYQVKKRMEARGIPWTRENFIEERKAGWDDSDGEEMIVEEDDLPEEFQRG